MFIWMRSSLLRRSGFSRTASDTPILPMSCSSPPHSRASISASEQRICRPMVTAISCTFLLWLDV